VSQDTKTNEGKADMKPVGKTDSRPRFLAILQGHVHEYKSLQQKIGQKSSRKKTTLLPPVLDLLTLSPSGPLPLTLSSPLSMLDVGSSMLDVLE
jgi:hypothetical protein